jgi:hypothetical protein
MFKQELPLMFPADEDVKAVRDAMFDPFEYLMAEKRDGAPEDGVPSALGQGRLSRSVSSAACRRSG